jgi:hypothetical protein
MTNPSARKSSPCSGTSGASSCASVSPSSSNGALGAALSVTPSASKPAPTAPRRAPLPHRSRRNSFRAPRATRQGEPTHPPRGSPPLGRHLPNANGGRNVPLRRRPYSRFFTLINLPHRPLPRRHYRHHQRHASSGPARLRSSGKKTTPRTPKTQCCQVHPTARSLSPCGPELQS